MACLQVSFDRPMLARLSSQQITVQMRGSLVHKVTCLKVQSRLANYGQGGSELSLFNLVDVLHPAAPVAGSKGWPVSS